MVFGRFAQKNIYAQVKEIMNIFMNKNMIMSMNNEHINTALND